MALIKHFKPTSYPKKSYDLVNYIDQLPTAPHAQLEGPYRAVNCNDKQYKLQSLFKEELKTVLSLKVTSFLL